MPLGCAEILGEDEELLWDMVDEMVEDGCLWIYGTGDEQAVAFTADGMEYLRAMLPQYKRKRSTALEIANQKSGQSFIPMRLGIVRPHGERAIVARQRLVEPVQLVKQNKRAIGYQGPAAIMSEAEKERPARPIF